jgi:signal transduction histidine kinase
MLLQKLIADHRDELLAVAKERMRQQRPASPEIDAVRDANLPAFLEAVVASIRSASPGSGEAGSGNLPRVPGEQIKFDIDELVHQYGSICYSAMEIARRTGTSISLREHQAFNQSLDDCIARTVTAWEQEKRQHGEEHAAQRLGFVAHELRNALHTAAISFQAIRTGRIPIQGLTGDVVERSHLRLRAMVERLLTQVRLGAKMRGRQERLNVPQLLQEGIAFVSADAAEKGIELSADVDRALEVVGDRTLIVSALTNLLQNAVKYSRREGSVAVRATEDSAGRVLIEIEDQCGGLPQGAAENLFAPFVQASEDRTGLGLGLTIAYEVVHAHGGSIEVRDLPGRGCVFVVALPKASGGDGT